MNIRNKKKINFTKSVIFSRQGVLTCFYRPSAFVLRVLSVDSSVPRICTSELKRLKGHSSSLIMHSIDRMKFPMSYSLVVFICNRTDQDADVPKHVVRGQ